MNPFSLLVNHPLDETYLSPPGDFCAKGELPEEETEVRQALTAMYVLTNRLMNISLWDRLLRTRKYSSVSRSAIEVQRKLMALVNSTPLHKAALRRPLPQLLKTDNGSEFAGKMLDKWVYEHDIRINFSRPGTPTDNAKMESFNGRLRQECQNENWFMSMEDARCKIEAWRILYNQSRPHSALCWMIPI